MNFKSHLLIHSIFLLVVFSESVFAQTLDIVPFPKGIYLTLDDLLSIDPSRAIELPNRKLKIQETRNLMIDFFNLNETPTFL